jgi:DNA-binding CsgD family transcriptional regulator
LIGNLLRINSGGDLYYHRTASEGVRFLARVPVLRCVAGGQANKEIADALSISEGTVKSHVNNIMQKLGALSRTDAAMVGLRKGLIKI